MGQLTGQPGGTHPTARDPQIERLIAVARVVLVAVSLLALYVDPLEPRGNNHRLVVILIVYLVIAVGLALLGRWGGQYGAWRIATHVADVGVAALLLHLSSLSVSPFFSYFIFVLLAGTLRWDAAGAVWTAAGAFVLYVAIVWIEVYEYETFFTDPSAPLTRFVVQASFLVVAGVFLAYFGRLNERNRQRFANLASWPPPPAPETRDRSPPLAPFLKHTAVVMKAPRIVVLWREADEPFVGVASWSAAGYREHRERDLVLYEAFDSIVADDLRDAPFAVGGATSTECLTADGRRIAATAAVHHAIASRFAISGVATARFNENVCRGRVFLLDRDDWGTDDLLLTEIVAARIGAEVEAEALRRQVEEIGAVRERARLARDLHDGVLQNLTAVRLRIAALEPGLGPDEREQLHGTAELLRKEQRRIREFVEATRSPVTAVARRDYDVRAEAERIVGNARETWGCSVALKVEPPDAVVAPETGRAIGYVLTETLANAIKHGHASRIDIAIWRRPDRVAIRVRNDGAPIVGGLGTFDLPRLDALDLGPRSVRERIATLGGSLVLTNRAEGVDLEMTLPLA